MNWDALGASGEILGAVGVIFTLIYLSRQIRDNTQVTRASTAQQMTNNWVTVNLEMSRNKVVTTDVDLNMPPEELQAVLSFWRAMFHQWSNCHYQYHHGALDEVLFEPTMREISTYAADTTVGPNLRGAWAATRFIFNVEFQAFVDELIAANPVNSDTLFHETPEQPS